MSTELRVRIESCRSRLVAGAGSLKLRIALGAVGALVFGVGLTAALLVSRAERDTLTAQRQREMVEASRVAAGLSRRVIGLQRALQATAARLDPATLADDAQLAAFMAAQPVVRSMFTHLFVTTPDGLFRISADATGLSRPGIELSQRDYFRRTVAEKRAIVSEALPGGVSGEPLVVFTYPLQSAGELYGVLGGALRLADHTLLGDEAEETDTASSAQLIVTDVHGHVLAHPDRQRLLQPLSADPRLAQAFAEWSALGSPVEPAGLRLEQADELVSAAGVAGPDWMIWRVMPAAELLAPLHAARRQSLTWMAGLCALVSAAMLVLLWRLLRPLTLLEHRAQHLFDAAHDPQLGWPEAGGEIGRLGRVLRHVGAERAQLEAFNTQVLQKLGSVMSAAPVGICFTRQRRFELVSAEFCHLLGRTEAELLGQEAAGIYASPEAYAAVGAQVARAFGAGQPYVGECEMRHADGTCFWARLRGAPVDSNDATAGTIWTMNDIGDQRAQRAELEWSASHDVLTGLSNRKALDGRLGGIFNAMPRSVPAAIVMIDLDHFKPINDTAGHAAGDAMLCAVAAAITGCVRASDLAVRLGGDEFAVLLERCAPDVALRIAENLRGAITAVALTWQQHTLRVGASLGVASLSPQTATAAAWLEAADAACYRAKAAGRDTVRTAIQ